MVSDGWRKFSQVLFQLLGVLETWQGDTKSYCFYKADEDGRIKSSWKVYLCDKKVLTNKSSQPRGYPMKSKTSQHMVQRFFLFVRFSTFFPNANRCIMSGLTLAWVSIFHFCIQFLNDIQLLVQQQGQKLWFKAIWQLCTVFCWVLYFYYIEVCSLHYQHSDRRLHGFPNSLPYGQALSLRYQFDFG